MNINKRILGALGASLLAVVGIVTIIASGGGGGGGGDGVVCSPPTVNSYDPAIYVGETNLVGMTEANTPIFVTLLMEGASPGQVVAQVAQEDENAVELSHLLARLDFLNGLRETIHAAGVFDEPAGLVSYQECPPGLLTGNCGGSFYYIYNYDYPNNTGSYPFNGGHYYLDFCDFDINTGSTVTVDGYSKINGVFYFDEAVGAVVAITSFTENTEAIKQTVNDQALIVSGSQAIDVPLNAMSATLTVNIRFRDVLSEAVYQYENLVFISPENTIEGAIYHPQLGKVDVNTTQSLVFFGSLYPTGGSITLWGADIDGEGPWGRTSAIVTFQPNETYLIEVDNNGDGVYNPPITIPH